MKRKVKLYIGDLTNSHLNKIENWKIDSVDYRLVSDLNIIMEIERHFDV